MEHYKAAIGREILFRLLPSTLIVFIALVGIIVLIKCLGLWELKSAKLFAGAFSCVTLIVCILLMFFDTKDLFADLYNNDFVEYYGEAMYDTRKSSKDFACFLLNDEKQTVVISNVGKVETTIDKCIARIVYGQNSKFVVVFEVEKVLEEKPPINQR